MTFEHEKNQFLKKIDKSSKGKTDKAILPLIKMINRMENFYTTSSCAGRILLMKETGKKQKNVFFRVWHEKINFAEAKKTIEESAKKYLKIIYLKQEPCILHVSCKNLFDALRLVSMARQAGWKKSGITSKRFMTELVSTEILAAPVAEKGNLLVNNDYLKILVKEANSKLFRTRQKIKNLQGMIKKL